MRWLQRSSRKISALSTAIPSAKDGFPTAQSLIKYKIICSHVEMAGEHATGVVGKCLQKCEAESELFLHLDPLNVKAMHGTVS